MTREFTGRHMAMIMALFFATVLAANLAMVFAARYSWSGLVVKNSYVASQQFNEVTAELEKAVAMGIHAALTYDSGTIRASFVDKAGRAASASHVMLKLGRPSYEAEDRELAMTAASVGEFTARAELAAGIWTGELSAEIGGRSWRRPVRLLIIGK
jgi:nitrogen fixation protein FixH